jgi:predicted transcriptional regulator
MSKYDNEWLAETLNSGLNIARLASLCGITKPAMSQYLRRNLTKTWIVKRGRRGDEVHDIGTN